ncbi:phosphoglucosamine mutase [Aestuariivirga sp. YIM B02566]|uniref:Phosphoglucosamine mutase n=1 Tax=Taklimakanibacter albus TaxID=2800327 RepID=A0ACC5R5W6_9HYPH|nr:phosphoglucosamine mutase [Aestuariivirga sp. YIM B02566]MBK1867758.1 phosphoglucosamine mutase [Aestuariivirga sp. YIM B02566]
MSRKYFGTDGVRGVANRAPMSPDMVMKIGLAAGSVYSQGNHRHRAVIGKDTRLSGYMIEQALTAGLLSAGVDVFLFGPLPTPAVAMLTRSLRADLGIMISASHNPYYDNGIKLFGPDGYKLSDAQELAIEKLIDTADNVSLAAPQDKLGRAKRIEDAQARYIEFAKRTFPKDLRLEGLRIVIDSANGGAYRVASAALWELGAEIIPIGNDPNGFNINEKCGSTAPEAMCAKVVETRADIGIALDGDADRVVIADEHGKLIDGDQLMALIATSWHSQDRLSGGGLVATIMSNLGLERHLADRQLTLARTKVGDRYVVEHMRQHGFNIGGEQSGHIVMSDFSTTGDGLVAALQVLAEVVRTGKPVSQVCHIFEPVPQILKNVRYGEGKPLETKTVKQAIADATSQLGASGRLVIRPSGTEPLIRVMAEGDDAGLVAKIVDDICMVIGKAA